MSQNEDRTFLTVLTEILRTWRISLPFAILTMAIGIGGQINWIQIKCAFEPFFGSSKSICQHNAMRLVAGGPAITIVCLLLLTWLQKKTPEISLTRATISFWFLSPVIALPFVETTDYRNNLTISACLVALFATGWIYRKHLTAAVKAELGSKNIRIEFKRYDTYAKLIISGKFEERNRDYTYDAILLLITGTKPGRQSIELDLAGLNADALQVDFIFRLVSGWTAFHNVIVYVSGHGDIPDLAKSFFTKTVITQKPLTDGRTP